MFPIANLMSSIPVFSILIRYNLINSGICKKHTANLFAVLLPWVLSLFFYAGNQLSLLMSWSAAIFFVLLNFVIPLYMFIVQYRRRDHAYMEVHWDESDASGSTPMGELDSDGQLPHNYNDESTRFDTQNAFRMKDPVYVLPEVRPPA